MTQAKQSNLWLNKIKIIEKPNTAEKKLHFLEDFKLN
jgi:hypothetical protein